jgi:hypothetical protein
MKDTQFKIQNNNFIVSEKGIFDVIYIDLFI